MDTGIHIIVLAGLVSIEKHQLAIELAHHYEAHGQTVSLLDHVARLALDSEALAPTIQLTRHISTDMADVIAWASAQITNATSPQTLIVALNEQIHPEAIFMALHEIAQHNPALHTHLIAMIDLRTCDCFPNVRQLLETYADSIVMMPYDLDAILMQIVYTKHESP